MLMLWTISEHPNWRSDHACSGKDVREASRGHHSRPELVIGAHLKLDHRGACLCAEAEIAGDSSSVSTAKLLGDGRLRNFALAHL